MLGKEAVALQALAAKIVDRRDEMLVERGAHKVCVCEDVRLRGVCEAPGVQHESCPGAHAHTHTHTHTNTHTHIHR